MDEDHTLIAQIVEVAHARGLNQKALAARSGISEETLSRMKKRGSGNVALVAKLAQATGMRLGLVDLLALPQRRQHGRGSFRDKYAVALAWSNKEAPDDVLVRLALVKPRFQMLLDAAVEFGVGTLSEEWERLKADGTPEALKVRATTERILGHIQDGYRQTTA
jgi:transcriptional regulator with XRE-family HTH domain